MGRGTNGVGRGYGIDEGDGLCIGRRKGSEAIFCGAGRGFRTVIAGNATQGHRGLVRVQGTHEIEEVRVVRIIRLEDERSREHVVCNVSGVPRFGAIDFEGQFYGGAIDDRLGGTIDDAVLAKGKARDVVKGKESPFVDDGTDLDGNGDKERTDPALRGGPRGKPYANEGDVAKGKE